MAARGEKKDLNLQQAIEQGTQRTTLRDLEKKGVQNVKILDEKALQELVGKAVDRVIGSQTDEQREKLLAESRKELDRLMKERAAARTRAELAETDKNELIEQVEALQKELSLQAELEEENLHKKFLEGTASMEKRVEEIRENLKSDRERLEREVDQERSRIREIDQARRDAVQQVLILQHESEAAVQELRTLKEELLRQRAEITRLKEKGGTADADKKALEASQHSVWMLESRLSDLQRQHDALEGDGKAGRAEARKAAEEVERLKQELQGEQARAEAFRAKTADLDRLQAEVERLEKRSEGFREELDRTRQAAAVEAAVLKERMLEVEHLKAKVIEEHGRAEALVEAGKGLRDENEKLRQAAAVDAAVLVERVIEVGHLKAKVIEEHERAEALVAAGRGLRGEIEKVRRSAAVNGAVLQERTIEVEHLKKKVIEEHDHAEALKDVERALRADLDRAVKSIAEVSALEAEARGRLDSLRDTERDLKAELARAVEERERFREEADRQGARAAELEGRLAAAVAETQGTVESARRADAERSRLSGELEALRQELASAIARQAEREKEAERRRETAVVVEAEIQKIEDIRHAEEKELEGLRAEAAGLRSNEERLRAELGEMRIDIRGLYEIVAREQGLARAAQDESVSLHAKALDIQGHVGGLESALAELRTAAKHDLAPEVARLKEALAREKEVVEARLKDVAAKKAAEIQAVLKRANTERQALAAKKAAEIQAALKRAREEHQALIAKKAAELQAALKHARDLAAKKAAPDPRVAKLQAALKARPATPAGTRRLTRKIEALRAALAKKKKTPAGSAATGVGLDGRGLLEDFLGRVQLKELFQKHVPVQGRNGRTHPSETLLEVVEAAAAGPRAVKEPTGSRLEVYGAPGKPTLDELKAFQARLAPRAVRQIERVHDGLRHQLVPLPSKGERLVLDLDMPLLDVGKKGRLGSYRPLVCFDGARGEFWKARLRSSKADDADGVLPFLREVLAKVPRGFARGRVLLRLDARFFSEPVLRFLERSGAGYVMPATDSKDLRAAARKAPLREISGGWSVGECETRVHPIRATKARYVVLRRKASKPGPAPTFSDGSHAYHLLLADKKTGPWRAWTAVQDRPAVLEAERGLLAGWAESPLLGRGRRARTAAFTSHLLASDLLQWFKRAGLPPAEQGRSQESLRKDVLLLSPPDDKRRESTVLVLPKKDARRRLYRKVADRLDRLRTSAPFKLGR
jgi:hypothetical protein